MMYKKIGAFLLILVIMNTMMSLFGKNEYSEDLKKIIGDYELYYPLGIKGVYYFNFYMKNGKLFTKQEGVKDAEELVLELSNPLSYKSTKDGNIYRFFKNRFGKVDKIVAKTKKTDVNGTKLPERIYKKMPIDKKYSVKAMKDDYDQMVRIMKFLHPAKYDYTPEKEFEKFIKNSRAKIIKPMKINEFFEIAAPVVSMLGCSHSSLRPSKYYRFLKEAKYFPIGVHLIKNKLYIIESLNKKYSYLKGAEVISINGESIHLIKRRMFNFLSSQWHNIQYKEYSMSAYFNFYYYYIYGSVDKFQIQYKINNITETVEIEGLFREKINEAYKKLPKHPIYLSKDYSITFLKNNKIALMFIKHFEFYQKDQSEKFYKFIDKSFSEIKNRKVKNLMIDIRGNGGGYPGAAQYLLSYLIQKPFQYFSKFHTAGGEAYRKLFLLQNANQNLFTGNLITLVDNGNLSTSGHFVSLLKYHKIGKLAGIITSSNFNCTHGESQFYLRNTGMFLRMSKERFSTSVKGQKIDEGISPDIKIDLTLKDLLDRRDLQLEKALELFSVVNK